MINIEDFNSNLLKIDKKSYKNNDIYYIGCITINDSDYENINSGNPLLLIISKVDWNIEEKYGNKYLILTYTDNDEEVLTKSKEFWHEIKNLIECNSIEKINDRPRE